MLIVQCHRQLQHTRRYRRHAVGGEVVPGDIKKIQDHGCRIVLAGTVDAASDTFALHHVTIIEDSA